MLEGDVDGARIPGATEGDEIRVEFAQAAAELAEKYRDLLDIDTRLERLDKTVAENERRIRQVTRDAKTAADKYDFRKLVDLIESAQKLQGHNEELFKLIDRTEHRLSEVAEAVAKQYREVTQE